MTDREIWYRALCRMAVPVLDNLSREQLKPALHPEYSPTWDGRNKNVAYLECFARLMAGIAPWLAQEDCEPGERALKRMQRYACIVERLISPEGYFPTFGRSATYRTAAFQPLTMLTLGEQLPPSLPYGQVRSALTKVIENMMNDANYDKSDFLVLGFNGHQPEIADYYTNTGSLYMASLIFLPLGLPASHPFWTVPAEDWTMKRAWSGVGFPIDRKIL